MCEDRYDSPGHLDSFDPLKTLVEPLGFCHEIGFLVVRRKKLRQFDIGLIGAPIIYVIPVA